MNCEYIAHVRKKEDGTWAPPHKLSDHIEETARLAEAFAAEFQSGAWGKAAGLAHDAGKGRLLWQKYLCLKSGYYDEEAHLEGKSGKVPHAIHGAELVEQLYGKESDEFWLIVLPGIIQDCRIGPVQRERGGHRCSTRKLKLKMLRTSRQA